VDGTESPEWESANERTVKWDKEQTRYLRERLRSQGGVAVSDQEWLDSLPYTHRFRRPSGGLWYAADPDPGDPPAPGDGHVFVAEIHGPGLEWLPVAEVRTWERVE
jgi:hypothetical protein